MRPFMTMGLDMPPMSLVQRTFLPWGFCCEGGSHSLGRFFWRERPFCSGPRQRYQSLGSGAFPWPASAEAEAALELDFDSDFSASAEADPTLPFWPQPMSREDRRTRIEERTVALGFI